MGDPCFHVPFFPTQKRSHLAKPWSCRIRRQKVAEPKYMLFFIFTISNLNGKSTWFSMVFSLVYYPLVTGPAPSKKKRSLPVGDLDTLREQLGGDCLCKQQSPKGDKPSCLWKFSAMPLFGRLRDWRTAFKELHKLDQDRLVTWFLFSVIWVPIFPCFSSCCSSIWRIVSLNLNLDPSHQPKPEI